MKKYEIVKIDNVEVTLDLSLFRKTEELYFNATEIAKYFGKDIRNWLRQEETILYLKAVLEEYPSFNCAEIPQLEFGKLFYSNCIY